jgi:hypothetical protein
MTSNRYWRALYAMMDGHLHQGFIFNFDFNGALAGTVNILRDGSRTRDDTNWKVSPRYAAGMATLTEQKTHKINGFWISHLTDCIRFDLPPSFPGCMEVGCGRGHQ